MAGATRTHGGRAAVVVVAVVAAAVVAQARVDPLFRARCYAKCFRAPDKIQCESECGLLTRTKPGRCPERQQLRWHDKACVSACSEDVDCEDVEKCCSNGCGATCQLAAGLDQEPGLPAVPGELTVTDSKGQRAKKVQWSPSSLTADVVYVLQQRSHVGLGPDPRLFGPWKSRNRRRRNSQLLTGLKPAHWYQVRVAAVNANGSRGYSAPSDPFTLQIGPSKPEEPRNLTVQRPGWVGGRLWAELRWRRAPSDLPLQHYKVFWSHCERSGSENTSANGCKHKSVIVKQKTVNYKTTTHILKDLEPQSLYFVQVQAVTVIFGSKKLSSEKAAVFIDTNKLRNATYNWRLQPERVVRDLRVINYHRASPATLEARVTRTASCATYNWRLQPERVVRDLRVINYHRASPATLEARVTWSASPGRFLVKWVPQPPCKSGESNQTNEATTEDSEFYIDNLEFSCVYRVSVSAFNNAKSAMLTITTPSCREVVSNLPCS